MHRHTSSLYHHAARKGGGKGSSASFHAQLCGSGGLLSRLGLETAQRTALLDRQTLFGAVCSVRCATVSCCLEMHIVHTAACTVHVAAGVDRRAEPDGA